MKPILQTCVSLTILASSALNICAQVSGAAPKLQTVKKGDKSHSIYVLVPVGYSGPELSTISPSGKKNTVDVIQYQALPQYLKALAAYEDFVAPLSSKEAKKEEAKIVQLYSAVEAADRTAKLGEARMPALTNSAGRAMASLLSGISSNTTRPEDRLFKKQAMLSAPASIIDSKTKNSLDENSLKDAKTWSEDRKAIRQCRSMLESLRPDEVFTYTGGFANLERDPQEAGNWKLLQGGTVIDTKSVP